MHGRGIVSVGDYKIVLHRQEDGSWVAEIPAISGCYVLAETRDAALAELTKVFSIIADEYRDKGLTLPADSTEIVHAERGCARILVKFDGKRAS